MTINPHLSMIVHQLRPSHRGLRCPGRRSCEALQLALAQAASSDDFAAQLAGQLQTSQVEEVLLLRHRRPGGWSSQAIG